jgi:hypothetical protein
MRFYPLLPALAIIAYGCQPTGQTTTTTKTLSYDSVRLTLEPTGAQPVSLQRGDRVVFTVTGVNDAFNDIQFTMKRTNKSLNVPASLSAYIPVQQTSVTAHVVLPGAAPPSIKSDYDKLNGYFQLIGPGTKALEKEISDLQTGTDTARVYITNALDSLGRPKDGQNDLKNDVNDLLTDFKLRFQLAKDNGDIKNNAAGLDSTKDADFVAKNEALMRKFPDILLGYLNAKAAIDSKKVSIDRDDFLDVTFNIYGHKYADKEDTLLTRAIRFYRINYISIDFTAGFFGSNLYSPSYHFTDSLGHIAKESGSKLDISVGGLFHTYYVWGPAFKIGLCVGAGISVWDSKPKFLIGPSIVIGRSKEFSLSGGYAYASIPVPSNAVNTNFQSSVETAVPTYNKTMTGFFLGVTYNIISKIMQKWPV